ncbi:hypothetical protein T09_15489 [Trichinella sp. T9]|nr:hypothetical protein T09_15489 [Trichinella sp. T9]
MATVLRGLVGFDCLVYLDDVITAGEHTARLREVHSDWMRWYHVRESTAHPDERDRSPRDGNTVRQEHQPPPYPRWTSPEG